MGAPFVVAEPPTPAWVVAADAPRPPIGDYADARLTSFEARRAPDGSATLVHGCVSAKIPGWVEDMRPKIEASVVGLTAYNAGQIADTPIEARPEGGALVLRATGGPRRGSARTFIGFEADRVSTCWALCVARESDRPACDASVADARLEGSMPPPPPGFALRAISWAVYHPTHTALTAGVIVAFASVVAVARRRRPRARI
jgi:hypothetical protein